MIRLSSCVCALLFVRLAFAAPAVSSAVSSAAQSVSTVSSAAHSTSATATSTVLPSTVVHSSTVSATEPSATGPFIGLDPNGPLWNANTPGDPQPIRGSLGAPLMGPTNTELVKQNPDLLAPPTTDHVGSMPIATEMAGVNMRLEPGAVRELHWHKTSEWAYVLKGKTQITSVDTEGRNFISTVGPGDLWYFPPGIPHSLQATNDDPEGSEFVLVFDSGEFSEDSTFLVRPLLAKNFQAYETYILNLNIPLIFSVSNISAFDHIPAEELYIFPAALPEPDSAGVVSPQGAVPDPFSFAFSQVKPTQLSGGTVKVVDSSTFAISKTISAAEVTVEPGAIRELHWHPTQDEWSLFLEGTGRVSIFASQSNARTFNYQPGDIGHYVENTGNTTLKFLEIFNTDKFQDVSLAQISKWLALTPPKLVQEHLGLPTDVINRLSKTKHTVVGPA
ncbi:hypothetical protein DXG01_014602 [Tephrocybe rancida]|nr:hypothetical protein DXG01_014602 [Tephrocybe rancida]